MQYSRLWSDRKVFLQNANIDNVRNVERACNRTGRKRIWVSEAYAEFITCAGTSLQEVGATLFAHHMLLSKAEVTRKRYA